MRRSVGTSVLAIVVALGFLALAFGACVPTYSFSSADSGPDSTLGPGSDGSADHGLTADAPAGDTSSGDASADGATPPADGGVDAPAVVDAGVDAPVVAYGDAAPVDVANVGFKPYASGYGYQLHLVYAENDGRFWLFYADDTAGVIEAVASPDLVTWTAETPISLGSASLPDGYGFSVAYANLAATDVLHFVADVGGGGALDVRATISGGAITGAAPFSLPDTNGGCGSDGPQVAIHTDGRVYEVTALSYHPATGCDTNIYRSAAVDPGGSSFSTTYGYDGYFVSVPDLDYAHTLVDMPEAGVVLALWPDDDDTSDSTHFETVGWALSPSFDGGGPDAYGDYPVVSQELFYGRGLAGYDDWTACRLSDQDIHVVRHVYDADAGGATALGSFQEEVFDGTAWRTGSAPSPPPLASPTETGVVLVSDANPTHGMLLAALGTDNSINLYKWTSSGGWTTLPPLPGAAGGTKRQSLAGSGCGSRRPALFWTEGTGPYELLSLDVGALLAP